MRGLIKSSREALVNAPDTVCLDRARLVTEAYKSAGDASAPVLRAKALRHILTNMTLDLVSNPIFAGNTSSRPRAWMLLPEYGFAVPGQADIENPGIRTILDGDIIPSELREFWKGRSFGGAMGYGHLAIDYAPTLHRGLEASIEEAGRLNKDETDPEKRIYREACAIALESVIAWAARYAKAAREASEEASDPPRKAALARVAEACAHVPAKPARNLFEALQTITLLHLAVAIEGHAISNSIGLLDRYLAPFHHDDSDATELLAAFMLKIASVSVGGSFSKTQAITIGGVDSNHHDRCNPLTLKVLEACELARVPDPHVFVRWHKNIGEDVKTKALRMLADGMSMPLLIGDEETANGFIRAGIAERDAWDYCVIGCNELGIPGRLIANLVWLHDATVLRETLIGMKNPDSLKGMSDLIDAFKEQVRSKLRKLISNKNDAFKNAAKRVPTPLTSSLMNGCLEWGKDLHEHMPYNHLAVVELGFTNLINALAGIEKVVFQDRAAAVGDVVAALRNNFTTYEDLRRRLARAPKWGSDDETADKWAREWVALRDEALFAAGKECGREDLLRGHVVRSLHHLHGRQVGATPDGRLAREPFADSIGAPMGTNAAGPTAILNSVLKMKASERWNGGYNLNLTLPRASLAGPNGVSVLRALTESFFERGGQELQIGSLSSKTLKDARAHPEKYPDLLVRVAGFNALFARLAPEEQEELIQRAEAAESAMR